jgi:hypothetical protein
LGQLPGLITRHRSLGLVAVAALALSTCSGGGVEVDGTTVAATTSPAPLPRSEAITLPVHGADATADAPGGHVGDIVVDDEADPVHASSTSQLLGGADASNGAGDGEPVENEAGEHEAREHEAREHEAGLPEQVDLVEPDLVLRAGAEAVFAVQELEALREHPVAHVAAVTEFDLDAEGPEGATGELTAFAVDVDDFRPVTPDVTAQTVGVWQRLLDGDVLVRHDVAHELGLELGGTVLLRTEDGSVPARIGAFAANGAPPLADLLVPREVGSQLGATGDNTLVVAGEDADPTGLGDELAAALDADAEVLQAPVTQRSAPKTSGSITLEPFSYTSRGDGTIKIDPSWVQSNIVVVEIPGLGNTQCHRAMVPQLLEALREVHEAGLYGHFERDQFAGCFMPRHILWNPNNGLSMHAWGLAIDFNAVDNAFGKRPVMDPRIVEIFKRWGFEWGGDWSTPDGMHFQLARIVETP